MTRALTVIGVPCSAGAHHGGLERGPAALRSAGLPDRLRRAGCEVSDAGDLPAQLFTADAAHPRARNRDAVVQACRDVAAAAGQVIADGGIPVLLGGDCSITVGAVAGCLAQHPGTGVLYLDGDADLRIKKSCCEAAINLGERKLLFVPSAFAWPHAIVIHDCAWQPTIIYPVRGAGTLWQRAEPIRPPMLGALIGRRRAAILLALDEPRSTIDLAKSVGLSPGGVSQHLAVMRNAGLLDKHRVRREVLYWRSPAGESLLAATAPAE